MPFSEQGVCKQNLKNIMLEGLLIRRLMFRVQKINLGCHFFASKVAFSRPSEDRFGKAFGGLMTLGQVKSVPNVC